MKVEIAVLALISVEGERVQMRCASKKQKGFCVEWNGRDQNSGVHMLEKISNGYNEAAQLRCLQKCRSIQGATGCEVGNFFLYKM